MKRIRRATLGLMWMAPALALGWAALHLGMADWLAERDPQAALRWWPHHAGAQLQIATQASEPERDHAEARRLASDVLARTPLAGGRTARARTRCRGVRRRSDCAYPLSHRRPACTA
ncbi:MAG: hypothetical protein IPH50_03390 [Rhodanobacteraceae bacterium]|nr:hypothetical protein [Rhodanobacteraceae bacterium]